jgi:HD-like signal output (HDOD) protein
MQTQSRFMDHHYPTADHLVKNVISLVSLPEVCLRIVEMVSQGDCHLRDFEEVITQDPALTARLLRVVNSSLYGARGRIDTISRAVSLLGYQELRDLVLATSAAGVFERIPNELSNMDQFWRHAVLCGILSRQIAHQADVLHAERMFVAGLLHDIGRLVLYFKLPDPSRMALELARDTGMSIYHAEQDCIGFDHAQVGNALMKHWGLSPAHQSSTQFHHEPAYAGKYIFDAAIVHLADMLTHMVDGNRNATEALNEIDPVIWDVLTIEKSICQDLVLDAHKQFAEIILLFRPERKIR